MNVLQGIFRGLYINEIGYKKNPDLDTLEFRKTN